MAGGEDSMGEEFVSSEVIQTAEGRQYHIGLAPGEVAPFIIMSGHVDRVYKIAKHFEEASEPISCREYTTITGKYNGLPVSAMALGMGADNMEIAIIELANIVENPTMIRVGSSGAVKSGLKNGDLVVSSGAVRMEETSTRYVVEGYPSIAHHEVALSLLESAKTNGRRHYFGLTATACSFYGAEGRSTPHFKPRDPNIVETLEGMNVLNLEMEASTLFSLSTLAGYRAGAVCAIYAERQGGKFISKDEQEAAEADCIKVALGAVENLAKMDNAKGDNKYWLPHMGL